MKDCEIRSLTQQIYSVASDCGFHQIDIWEKDEKITISIDDFPFTIQFSHAHIRDTGQDMALIMRGFFDRILNNCQEYQKLKNLKEQIKWFIREVK